VTPSLLPDAARERFAAARVARLASVRPDGGPHLVPVVFAVLTSGGVDTVVSAVDHKPKRTTALQRLADVAHEPRVSVLADAYAEDWDRLWWVRADGDARTFDPDDPQAQPGLDALVARYPQYADRRPAGPVLAITVSRWTGWSAT
jgi:PPOX class probable F420-dependent enzyme